MEGSAATRGEGSAEEKRESAPLDESAPAPCPTIMAEKPGDDESPENRGRAPLPKIMAARSGEPEPSLEEKVRQIRVTMSARAETISVLEIGATTHAETISVQGIGAPTTQVEPPQGACKAPVESENPNLAGGRPQATLFPHKKKKIKKIKPLVADNLIIVGEQLGQNVSGQPPAPNANNDDEGDESELGEAFDEMLEREVPKATSPQPPQNGDDEVDYDSDEDTATSQPITGGGKEESGAPLSQCQNMGATG
jgi:hypothetical protein